MRIKLIAGWALAVALLVGLQLMGGPTKAGADVTPVTLTGMCSAAPGATSVTCTWTINAPAATTTDVLFNPHAGPPNQSQAGCGPFPFAGCIAYAEGHDVGASGVLTFTQFGIPCTTEGQALVDTLFSNPAFPVNPAGSPFHFIDVTGSADLPGSCPDPTPTTTTTVPVTPTSPGTVGQPPLPTGPSPVPAAPAGNASPPPPTAQPLAFTGAPVGAEAGVALFLIACGLLLVRKGRRVAS